MRCPADGDLDSAVRGRTDFHSDRGVQYASHEFRRRLKANGILGSMRRKGDCWDNSVVETFFWKLTFLAGSMEILSDVYGSLCRCR
ncbi:MAG: hypothetical protein EBT06_08860 [Gammaproteobacteria bacterium]|nr:hypothetical protein [Gammaproteobacteria bacterium]NBT45019.1 hypothetical protein [Gammaproteobacteria bacterium]NBY22607.1 hypothetical protein [Gammaproteobacteria bacterium]